LTWIASEYVKPGEYEPCELCGVLVRQGADHGKAHCRAALQGTPGPDAWPAFARVRPEEMDPPEACPDFWPERLQVDATLGWERESLDQKPDQGPTLVKVLLPQEPMPFGDVRHLTDVDTADMDPSRRPIFIGTLEEWERE
jgi:hypothetical protein